MSFCNKELLQIMPDWVIRLKIEHCDKSCKSLSQKGSVTRCLTKKVAKISPKVAQNEDTNVFYFISNVFSKYTKKSTNILVYFCTKLYRLKL